MWIIYPKIIFACLGTLYLNSRGVMSCIRGRHVGDVISWGRHRKSLAEWCSVFSVFCFEVVLCESDVRFCCIVVFGCDGSLVDYWWLQAASVERACALLSAVACLVVSDSIGSGGAICIDAARMRLLWLSIILPNTETPPNSASISGPSKTTTSNTLFPGAFSHRTRRTIAQVKDVTSASKKNS